MRISHQSTPCIDAPELPAPEGRAVQLKLECLQPTGSFKDRGMGHLCATHVAAGRTHFYCSSGGNAGLALARAARVHGGRANVVVPTGAPPHMVQRIAREGAVVEQHGADWQEADTHLKALLAADAAGVYVSPFDDPLLWEGHASLVHELHRDGIRPAALVLSVGGGGLLAGVALGLRQVGWQDVPIVAVETRGADSLAQALAAGEPLRLPAITSVASSLGARQVTAEALEVAKRQPVTSLVVSDAQAVAGCLQLLDAHRLLVEPACGAAVAALGAWPPGLLRGDGPIVVVACGGGNVTWEALRRWSAQFGLG